MGFSNDFYNSFKFILALSRVSATFSIRKTGVEKRKYDWIRNLATVVVYFAIETFCFKVVGQYKDDEIVLVTTSKVMMAGSSVTYLASLMMSGVILRNSHIRLIRGLEQLQGELEELHGNTGHPKLNLFMKVNAAAQGIFTAAVIFVPFARLPKEARFFDRILVLIGLYYPLILCAIFTLQVTSYISFIKLGLRLMNKEIECMAHYSLDMPNFEGTSKKPTNTIMVLNKFCEVHHHLIGLIESINEAFSIDFLALNFYAFCQLVVGTYYIFCWELLGWRNVSNSAFKAFWLATNLIIICHLCHDTVFEANRTGILLYDIDTDDPELENLIDLFTLQIANEKVEFNAAGFFSINYKLLFAIFGGVTTYIIILMQLSYDKT